MKKERRSPARRFASVASVPLALSLALVVIAFVGCPRDTTPPGVPTGLTAVSGDAQVELDWTNPADGDFAGVHVRRSTTAFPSAVTAGDSVYQGVGQSVLDFGLENGTTYYYSVFAYDEAGNHSTAAQATGLPTAASAMEDVLGSFSWLDAFVLEMKQEVLDEEDKGALTDKLSESEMKYRSGDDCGAATDLLDFLDLAQGFRAEGMKNASKQAGLERAEAMEEAYNLARMIRYDMLAGLPTKSQCPGQERVGMVAEATPEEEDNTKVLALASLGEPRVVTVEGDGEKFTELEVPGADTDAGMPGEPAVPILRRIIAVPMGAEIQLDVQSEDAETIYLNLAPTQEQPLDEDEDPGNPPDPATFGNRPFLKNEDVYATDALMPPDPLGLTFLGNMREVRMYLLEVACGQYNPATDALTLFKNVSVDVRFVGGSGHFLTEASSHSFESNPKIYEGAVLNKASVFENIGEVTLQPTLIGEELMILTHPDFKAAADTLAAWKREKGIVTNVFECGTGSGIAGRTTNTGIDAFIKNRYDTAAVRPSYVLLLGDAEYIPPFYQSGAGTDWPYAILGAVGVDKVPDLAIGRIPVDTLTQANTVVTKIIAYEKTPPGSTVFYSNASIAAQFQCCRTDVAQVGTAQRTFAEVGEFSRNTMVAAGKTVQRIYEKTVAGDYFGDSTPRRWYDGTLIPAAIGPGSGFTWNGSTADITNAFNAGRFLIIHRDHGWEGGWSHPEFDWADADALTNGSLQPVVFSVNCASGFFDNETAGGAYGTTFNGVYFCERLLRKANGGSVGILCDSRNSPSWPNTALLKGFMDAIWPNALPAFGPATSQRRLGDILNHGKLYMMSQIGVGGSGVYSGDAEYNQLLWHVFGDPTMEIWTSNPNLYVLPSLVAAYRYLPREGLFEVDYATDGATITVFQQSAASADLIPIARGEVKDGTASMKYLNAPNAQLPLLFSASKEDAVATELEPPEQ